MTDKSSEKSWIRMYDVNQQYQIIDKVGRGTYGTVYKAKNLKNGKFYAIKKLENNDAKLQAEGFPITALREISLLKQMQNDNIIQLKEIILSKPSKRNLFRGSTFLVFQYMDHDLAGLFKNKTKFSLPEIKCIIRQLIKGVAYLHSKRILHRDIKSANILLNDNGQVKLADFGLGRQCRIDSVYTFKVVTLWYRAPQLLLGCKQYDLKVDIWSIGCVLAEFLIGQVLFKRESDFAQIQRIYQICGGIEENGLPEDVIKTFSYYNDLKPKKVYKPNLLQYLRKLNPQIDDETVSFLQALLCMNPQKRITCEQALEHPFFNTKPYPCRNYEIQKIDYECHEMFRDKTILIQRKSQSYSKRSAHNKSNFDKKQHEGRKDRKADYKGYDKDSERSYRSRHNKRDDSSLKKEEYYKYQDKKYQRKKDENKYYKDQRRDDSRKEQKRDQRKDQKRDDRKGSGVDKRDDNRDDKREYKRYQRQDKRQFKNQKRDVRKDQRDDRRNQRRPQRRQDKNRHYDRYYQNDKRKQDDYKEQRPRQKRENKYYDDDRSQSNSPSRARRDKYKSKKSSPRKSSYQSSHHHSSSGSRDRRSRDKEITVRWKKDNHY